MKGRPKFCHFSFRPNSAKCDACRSRPCSGLDHDQSLGRRKDTFSESANVNLTVDGKPGYEYVLIICCRTFVFMIVNEDSFQIIAR